MGTQDSEYDEASGHFDECPQYADPADPRCYCKGIVNAQDAYYDEG